ncbi:MAG: MFS transporter [Rickettsiaceae bacterium]|nr:MFS transporter [Rickettsiaceae bacterium]
MSKSKLMLSVLLANCLSHYDAVLYAMMGKILAQIFFSNDHISGLILTYSVPLIGIFIKPVATTLFGGIAITFGPARGLVISLLGMTICTFLIGCLPSYQTAGIWAPILLSITYGLQAMFMSGESTIAGLFIIENTEATKRSFISSIYNSSSIVGVCIATWATYLISESGSAETYWRWAYFGSVFTGLINIYLRYQLNISKYSSRKFSVDSNKSFNWKKYFAVVSGYLLIGVIITYLIVKFNQEALYYIKILAPFTIFISAVLLYRLNKNGGTMLKLMVINGSNYLNFVVPFIMFNILVPLMTKFTYTDMLSMNIKMTLLDGLLLPLFGWLGDKYGARRVMLYSAALMTITIIPLFSMIPEASYIELAIIRFIIVVIGIGFSAPSHKYFLDSYSGYNKYLVTGVSCAIGGELIRRISMPLSLYLWDIYGATFAISGYIAFVSLCATLVLYFDQTKPAKIVE